jgi:hypothetical protein
LTDPEMAWNENLPWVILWIFSMSLFVCMPFCINSRRRQLCKRRIRERRWIREEEPPDWYALVIQRQQQRRLEMETQQQRFQISRTQEDEIREQFIVAQLETYTIVSGVQYVVFQSVMGHGLHSTLTVMYRYSTAVRSLSSMQDRYCRSRLAYSLFLFYFRTFLTYKLLLLACCRH